jgi:fructan beta-fructosidase
VSFYRSPDLKNWTRSGEFGLGHGAHTGVWECPDFFELPIEGRPGESRWVLVCSLIDNRPRDQVSGFTTTVQYFVGRFDGLTFYNDHAPETVLSLVHGPDEYATTSIANVPDGRRLIIGWLSHWHYAGQVPTGPWKNALSLPRSLRLVQTPQGLRLSQQWADELASMRRPIPITPPPPTLPAGQVLTLVPSAPLAHELSIELKIPRGRVELRLRASDTQHTTLAYNATAPTPAKPPSAPPSPGRASSPTPPPTASSSSASS